jgi:hypothetical protein
MTGIGSAPGGTDMGKLIGLVVGVALLASGLSIRAWACGGDPNDELAVINARRIADERCAMENKGCANAPNHGTYVSCVARVTKDLVAKQVLPKSCRGAVKKCAAHSTCGKAGFITCCAVTPKGPTCRTRKDALACAGRGGTPSDPNNPNCCSDTHPLMENVCVTSSPAGAFLN